MSLPDITCELTDEQEQLVRLMRSKAQDITDTGQANDIEAKAAYLELTHTVEDVLLAAPDEALNEIAVTATPAVAAEETGSLVQKPSGFLRFLRVKANNWYRWVSDLEPPGSRRHKEQNIPYINATPYRPLAVGRPGPGEGDIHLYPAATASVSLVYVPKVAPEKIPSILLDPLLWLALSKYLQNDEPAMAKAANDRYMQVMGARFNKPEARYGEQVPAPQ